MTVSAAGFFSFQRKFRVFTDNPRIDQYAIFLWLLDPSVSNGYPNSGDTYSPLVPGSMYVTGDSSCPYSYLANMQLQEESEDGVQWILTASYEPYDPSVMGQINPLNAFTQASLYFEQRQQQVYWVYVFNSDGSVVTGSDGNPITHRVATSAGEAVNMTMDVGEPVLRITRNEASINVPLIEALMNRVNNDAITWGSTTYAAKTLKFQNYEVQWQYHPIIGVYYTVAYLFKVNYLTWIQWVTDQGTISRDPFTGIPGPNYWRDSQGTPLRRMSGVQLLDGNGYLQNPAGTPVTGRLETLITGPTTIMPVPIIFPFECYGPADYTQFNFVFPVTLPILPPWFPYA